MAKLSMKLKQARPAKFSTRAYTRCRICGRPHSVLRKYGICRVIDRGPKASWIPAPGPRFRGGIIIKEKQTQKLI